jgi:hypothetical protein
MSAAPKLVVHEIETGVRPVHLRLPFRFGAVTLTACPQLFVRVTVDVEGHRAIAGHAAELMVPKWFDKRGEFTPADNVSHLVRSVQMAAEAYLYDTPATAFELFARHAGALQQQGRRQGFTELSSAYGQAVIDRAVVDALCRALEVSFFDAAMRNLVGIAASPTMPDLDGLDWDAWLAARRPLRALEARHTVGMLDALKAAPSDDTNALPRSLPAAIATYGHRVFKIKLGGDPRADIQRLGEVLEVLDQHAPGHRYTLDGNEQYGDAAALSEFFVRLTGLAAFAQRPEALLYIEQPLPRERSLDAPIPVKQSPAPLLLDEADGTLDAFVRGRQAGWDGVSSKGCKGLYKALINRARCDQWNAAAQRDGEPPAYFMSAEDLTCQAGLAVQQDLALASLLGLTHCERNGHHYVDGFGDAPPKEQRAFAMVHGELYESSAGHPRLAIEDGRIAIDSLFKPGFAHRVDPDWRFVHPLVRAAAML